MYAIQEMIVYKYFKNQHSINISHQNKAQSFTKIIVVFIMLFVCHTNVTDITTDFIILFVGHTNVTDITTDFIILFVCHTNVPLYC